MYHSNIGCTILVSLALMTGTLSTAFAESLHISPQELFQKLNDDNFVILDSRPAAAYQQGHIPGAISFPELLTYHNAKANGRIAQPANIQTVLRVHGLDKKQHVVVYDNGEMMLAARVFWALEVYGFDHVKVLNQGFKGWLNQNLAVSFDQPNITPSNYVTVINHQRLATKLTTQIATKNPNQIIIDARKTQAYQGLESSAKRFGHIPQAINIPGDSNLHQQQVGAALLPIEELKQIYANIPKEKKIVLYCAIGRASSTNYLALRELGYNVANYDASWKEWGNDFNLPIENKRN